jgi:hypothetical protein
MLKIATQLRQGEWARAEESTLLLLQRLPQEAAEEVPMKPLPWQQKE